MISSLETGSYEAGRLTMASAQRRKSHRWEMSKNTPSRKSRLHDTMERMKVKRLSRGRRAEVMKASEPFP